MSPETTWNTIEEATSKYGLESSLILKWVEEGVIHAENSQTRTMRINAEDLARKVQHVKKQSQAFRDCD